MVYRKMNGFFLQDAFYKLKGPKKEVGWGGEKDVYGAKMILGWLLNTNASWVEMSSGLNKQYYGL